jgi:glucokinase
VVSEVLTHDSDIPIMKEHYMILAGDIGGTHTRIAVFDPQISPLRPMCQADYPSQNYPGLAEIALHFLSHQRVEIDRCCFGVAGPVVEGKSHPTNIPWALDSEEIGVRLGAPCKLINDLEANAFGIAALEPQDFAVLQTGKSCPGANAAVISAGTGLGEAGMFWDGATYRPFASEGGHTTFSPRNDLEIQLLNHLLRRFDHVSWERVLSGPGLVNIYEFFRDTGRAEEPSWLTDRLMGGDRAAVIAHAAIHSESELCSLALGLLISLYGSEAGNLALKLMALGGIYIGGGIAPRLLGQLKQGTFLLAFRDKGRMHQTLGDIPVLVILNDLASLIGAARCAVISM